MSETRTFDPKTDTTTCRKCRRIVRLITSEAGVCSGVMAKSCEVLTRKRRSERRQDAANRARSDDE